MIENTGEMIRPIKLTKAQWYKHIDNWRVSKESQIKYCKTQGLRVSSFGYWRQVYLSEKKDKQVVGFAKISSAKEVKPVEQSQIRLNFPSGISILINGNPSTTLLHLLLNCLGDSQ